jgi:hypothetical protein
MRTAAMTRFDSAKSLIQRMSIAAMIRGVIFPILLPVSGK